MDNRLIKEYICILYPIFSLIYLLHIFVSGIRTGITVTFFLLTGISGIILLGYLTVKKTEDILFSLFVLYNLLSGIWCVYFGMPFGIFIGEVSTTLLPMFLYYAGRSFDDEHVVKYYRYFILAALLMGGAGAVLYAAAPGFFIDFCFNNGLISKADAGTMRVRMTSAIGSGAMGCFAAYSFAVSFYFILKKEKKARLWGAVCAVLSAVFCFMANQRSAMFCVIVMLAGFAVLGYSDDKKKHIRVLAFEAAGVAAVVIGIFVFARSVFDKFFARLSSIPQGFGERSESWIAAVNNMENFWIGDGLGSHGHRAADFQTYIVADGGLVKIYAEMGLIGSAMIIFVVALVYIKSFRRLNRAACEIAVITSAILMSIGSNVLEIELCAPIVYFALGRAVSALYPAPQDIGAVEGADDDADEGDPVAVSSSVKESS